MTAVTVEQLPATVHLHFWQGDRFAKRFRFHTTADADIDISDWTITAQVRPYETSATVESFAVAFVTDGTDGEVDIELTPAQARRLAPRGKWDLQRVDMGAGIDDLTLLAGDCIVNREVTR